VKSVSVSFAIISRSKSAPFSSTVAKSANGIGSSFEPVEIFAQNGTKVAEFSQGGNISIETADAGTDDDDSVTFNPNGEFEFIALGETRDDVFTYNSTDQHGANVTSTYTVTVKGENETPVAIDDDPRTDAYDSPMNTNVTVSDVTIGVLQNDYDIDQNDTRTTTLVPNSFDTAEINAVTVFLNGTFDVEPVTSFVGETTFNYTVTDNNGAFSNATVTVSFYNVEFSRTIYSIGDDVIPIVTDAFADVNFTKPDEIFVDLESLNSSEGLIANYNLTESGNSTEIFFDNIKAANATTLHPNSESSVSNPRLIVLLDDDLLDTVTAFYRDVENTTTIGGALAQALEPTPSEPLRFNSGRYVLEETADLGLLDESFPIDTTPDVVSVLVRSSSSPSGILTSLIEEVAGFGSLSTSNGLHSSINKAPLITN